MAPSPEKKPTQFRILLIEDDASYAQVLTIALTAIANPSYELQVAGNLREGLGRFSHGNFDAVLLDLNLPDSHGIDTVTKTCARITAVPIVVLTAIDDDSLGIEALRKGAQEYLFKGYVHGKMLSRVISYAVERKRIEAELRKANQDLREMQMKVVQSEKLAALGRFSAGVAHQVRNPLGIILGGIEFIERKLPKGDNNLHTSIVRIKDSIQRADAILQGLLRFSGPSQLKSERIQPETIIQEAIALLKSKAPLKNITIKTEFQEKEKPWIEADKNQMQQVLFNLLMNAAESMPKGGEIRVKSSLSPAPGPGSDAPVCMIEVADSGGGIAKEDLSKVFEPFFTTKMEKKGIGLGLSVSKAIVMDHKGELVLESEKGKGTKARIFLPRAGK